LPSNEPFTPRPKPHGLVQIRRGAWHWVARRGIQLYISQILEAEATLARGDQIVEEMSREARECRKAGEQEKGL
jgi:hypothetical protein